MEITRQPDARRDQSDRDHERQTVLDHAAAVIVLLALIFGEAQQEDDVRLVVPDDTALCGLAGFGLPSSETNDSVIPIARLTRLGNHV